MNVGGEIGYYGLGEWWATELTEAERTRLEDVFHPMGSPNPRPLTEGKILRREGLTATPHGFLSALIGWLRATPEDRVTRRKIRAKIAELVVLESNPAALHFSLQALIKEYYRDRNEEPDALEAAIQACRDQIKIAPAVASRMQAEYLSSPLPSHVGYQQLAIILEKSGSYSEAIELCQCAQAAGWAGEWEKRIARCTKRLSKASAGH